MLPVTMRDRESRQGRLRTPSMKNKKDTRTNIGLAKLRESSLIGSSPVELVTTEGSCTTVIDIYPLISHPRIFPSKPEVTRIPSAAEYSMFFTQLLWPCRRRIRRFRFRTSHSATVWSSLQEANTRESRNLQI